MPTQVGILAIAIALSQALSFSFTETVLSSWHNTMRLCMDLSCILSNAVHNANTFKGQPH